MLITANSHRPEVSVVLPVYNGNPQICEMIRQCLNFLGCLDASAECIVVDDGSSDGTVDAIRSVVGDCPSTRILLNGHNHGKGFSVRTGCLAAQGEYVVFIDSDLAYSPDQIGQIVSALKGGADVAIACRVLPESRFEMSPSSFRYLYMRHLMSRSFNFVVQSLLLPGILDTQAGLKGFNRAAAQVIFTRQLLAGFTFDVEILYLAQRMGLKIEQVPIRFNYHSEPSTVHLIRHAVEMMMDLARIWHRHRQL